MNSKELFKIAFLIMAALFFLIHAFQYKPIAYVSLGLFFFMCSELVSFVK